MHHEEAAGGLYYGARADLQVRGAVLSLALGAVFQGAEQVGVAGVGLEYDRRLCGLAAVGEHVDAVTGQGRFLLALGLGRLKQVQPRHCVAFQGSHPVAGLLVVVAGGEDVGFRVHQRL